MKKSVMLTDKEPISPERNPVVTLEAAEADRMAKAVVDAMRFLRRDHLTRLQFIEFITSYDDRWSWSAERESSNIPHIFSCEDPYIPSYLKNRRPAEVDYWPDGYPDDWTV